MLMQFNVEIIPVNNYPVADNVTYQIPMLMPSSASKPPSLDTATRVTFG